MTTVVVGVSSPGAALAERVARALPGSEVRLHSVEEPVGALLPRLFRDPAVSGLVVVLAVGATVRLLDGCLRDKRTDPAVVAVDDGGRFAVALVSGHAGGGNDLTRRVAAAINAVPVITTASDVAALPSVDLLGAEDGWRIEASPEALRRAAAAVVNGLPVGLFQDAGQALDLPVLRQLRSLDAAALVDLAAVLVVSDREVPPVHACQMVYRPPTLVAGVGCSTDASADDILEALDRALAHGGLARGSVCLLASIDRRLDSPALQTVADRLGVPLRGFPAAELASVPGVPSASAVVADAVGTPGVCEPAALLASGATDLLVRKVKTARATAAIARIPHPPAPSPQAGRGRVPLEGEPSNTPLGGGSRGAQRPLASGAQGTSGRRKASGARPATEEAPGASSGGSRGAQRPLASGARASGNAAGANSGGSRGAQRPLEEGPAALERPDGSLYLVGLGPGSLEHLTLRAAEVLRGCQAVVGYGPYVDLVEAWFPEASRRVVRGQLGQETQRALEAIGLARDEQLDVALVSSGDASIYGMGGPLFRALQAQGWQGDNPPVEVVPGVTAALASNALLGAPLADDLALISLSDLLTPWSRIAERLEAAAQAEFVLALYNPASARRRQGIREAQHILLQHRAPSTPVALVRNALRPGSQVCLTTLAEFAQHDAIDMQTLVLVGNRDTTRAGRGLVSRRASP